MNKNKQTLLVAGVILWFITVLAALLFYGGQSVKPFDPDQKVGVQAQSLDYDANLVEALLKSGVKAGSVVHITDKAPCFCDRLSVKHQNALTNELTPSNYTFKSLNINRAIAPYVSRYPALAVIDEQKQLRYFGPYASGVGCWVGDDTVSTIARLAKANTSIGAVVNSDVEGCFCSFSSLPNQT